MIVVRSALFRSAPFRIARANIDPRALATRLQHEGANSFDTSWRSLLACVAGKHEQLTKARLARLAAMTQPPTNQAIVTRGAL